MFTAVALNADEAAATDATSAGAIKQVRQYLKWRCNGASPSYETEFADPEIMYIRVEIRAQYLVEDDVYPEEKLTSVRVACVVGRRKDGSLTCWLPTLKLRFHCYSREAIQRLVTDSVRNTLNGKTPRELSRFLLPESLQLAAVQVRLRNRSGEAELATLSQLEAVAEPLGDRTTRQRRAHAWCRDREVAELVTRLQSDRTSMLLLGESGVGKTTVLTNAIRQFERRSREVAVASDGEERRPPPRTRHRFWLTSGPRVIAGMQYLGQWEARCEGLIAELAEIQGVLCVDNLLGLVQAGSGSPGTSVAAFVMPYLERGELRLVAEATPRELDACRRLLPGLESLLQVVKIDAFEPTVACEVLEKIAATSQRHDRVDSAPGTVGVAYRLFRRFLPYQPFPGRCAAFVRNLLQRPAGQKARTIQQRDVVEQFSRETGVTERFLRDDWLLEMADVRNFFGSRVLGQDEAVDVATALVATFKAGLQDPQRPLATFLFCGPTGVGKTELAKTIAEYLFGSCDGEWPAVSNPPAPHARSLRFPAARSSRLVRLDMSEYSGYGAAQRLTMSSDGGPSELIKRLRAQPFAVVLLDEIEKADAEVFDVLLGAIDEGRITDRYGRTTILRSAVIIMTSNLGSQIAQPLGFDPSASPAYEREVSSFFRPEFLNRIDRVVTFQPLGQATILDIARKELAGLRNREGLVRAGLKLEWDPQVEELIAASGFDHRYGARPLQRTLERDVVAPLAAWLAENPSRRSLTLQLQVGDAGRIEILPRES